jgi:hypothetical protein
MASGRVRFSATDLGAISSVVQYVGCCLELTGDDRRRKFVYRGQPCGSDPLVPTIGRMWDYSGASRRFTRDDEIKLLQRFRRRVFPLLGKLAPLEALFVARHYGLPTRLLDWTANALYALYFACASRTEVDGAIWILRQRDDLDRFSLDPFELAAIDTEEKLMQPHARRGRRPSKLSPDQVKIIFPIFNSARIVAQDGIFTLHANPQKPLEHYSGVAFPAGEMDIEALYSMRLAADRKPALVRELASLGITHRTVFPDLDGIVRSLWETEVLSAEGFIRGARPPEALQPEAATVPGRARPATSRARSRRRVQPAGSKRRQAPLRSGSDGPAHSVRRHRRTHRAER